MAAVVDPKVSVVMPTFNRAHLIGESIQSVLDQTFQDFRFIIVDDGSSDATEAVVKGFNDPRIRYIYQEHKGPSGAWNTGIRNAKGRYIAFLASDDLWLPEMLETAVKTLDSKPDAGLFYAKASTIDENGKPLTQIYGSPERFPGQTLKSMLYGDFLVMITVVLRRKCFQTVGLFDQAVTGTGDWDMWIRMAKCYRFAYLDKVLAYYRVHPGQYAAPKSEHFAEICARRVKVLDRAFSDAHLSKEILAIKPLAYRNVYMALGLRWLSVGAWRESAHYFWKAMRISPNPFVTPFRIVWAILFWNVLSKTMWGWHLVSRLVDLRRGWRAAPIRIDQIAPDDGH